MWEKHLPNVAGWLESGTPVDQIYCSFDGLDSWVLPNTHEPGARLLIHPSWLFHYLWWWFIHILDKYRNPFMALEKLAFWTKENETNIVKLLLLIAKGNPWHSCPATDVLISQEHPGRSRDKTERLVHINKRTTTLLMWKRSLAYANLQVNNKYWGEDAQCCGQMDLKREDFEVFSSLSLLFMCNDRERTEYI